MRQTSGGWVTVLEEPQVTKEVLNLKEFLGTDKVRFIHSFNDRGSVLGLIFVIQNLSSGKPKQSEAPRGI